MDVISRVDDLVSSFAELPEAEIGHGPDHPKSPNASLRGPINQFFDQYPFVKADPGYVAFMNRYCSASTVSTEEDITIHVFAPVGEMNDPLAYEQVTEDGYFVFGFSEFWRGKPSAEHAVALLFGFDSTGKRRSGVYRSVRLAYKEKVPFLWHCATFLEWLDHAIHSRGHLWTE
jgi:hypothetical protein